MVQLEKRRTGPDRSRLGNAGRWEYSRAGIVDGSPLAKRLEPVEEPRSRRLLPPPPDHQYHPQAQIFLGRLARSRHQYYRVVQPARLQQHPNQG